MNLDVVTRNFTWIIYTCEKNKTNNPVRIFSLEYLGFLFAALRWDGQIETLQTESVEMHQRNMLGDLLITLI